jgi:hypothetical protein
LLKPFSGRQCVENYSGYLIVRPREEHLMKRIAYAALLTTVALGFAASVSGFLRCWRRALSAG